MVLASAMVDHMMMQGHANTSHVPTVKCSHAYSEPEQRTGHAVLVDQSLLSTYINRVCCSSATAAERSW
jgi:hypothetical protein